MTIDQIIAGLSEAQKRAIIKPPQNNPRWLARCGTTTVIALCRRNLVDYPDLPARLTTLGQSVRARLKEIEGG